MPYLSLRARATVLLLALSLLGLTGAATAQTPDPQETKTCGQVYWTYERATEPGPAPQGHEDEPCVLNPCPEAVQTVLNSWGLVRDQALGTADAILKQWGGYGRCYLETPPNHWDEECV